MVVAFYKTERLQNHFCTILIANEREVFFKTDKTVSVNECL